MEKGLQTFPRLKKSALRETSENNKKEKQKQKMLDN